MQHKLAVQLACCLAIPLWEVGQVVASAGRLAHPAGAQSPQEEGCWVMRLELRDPREQRGSREKWSGMGEEGICCFRLSQDQLRRDWS